MAKKEKVKKPFYKKWWVWVIAIIVVIGVVAVSGEEQSSSGDSSKSEKTDETKEYAVGDEVKVGDLTYKVNDVEETNTITSVMGDKTTDGKYVIVDLSITNNDKASITADSSMFKIKTSDGTEYSADSELDTYVNEDIGFFLEEINPNISKTGKVVFELPADAEKYNIEVSSGFGWSSGEYQNIKLK